jgi:HlyD family secretion protein
MKKTQMLFLFAVPVAVSVACLFAMGSVARNGAPVSVDLATVTRGPLEERVSGSGCFVSPGARTIFFENGGAVLRVPVREGDRVRKGEVLLEFETKDCEEALLRASIGRRETASALRLKLADLRAAWVRAELARKQAERTFEGTQGLLAVQGATVQAYIDSRDALASRQLDLDAARGELLAFCGLPSGAEPPADPSLDGEYIARDPGMEEAELGWAAAKRALGSCTVRSPSDGVVTALALSPGDRVQAGAAVARIEDLSTVVAEVNMDEVDVGKVEPGAPAEIASDSMIGQSLSGRVDRIAPAVQTAGAARVVKVTLKLEGVGAIPLPGASCTARILSRLRGDVLRIPASSLVGSGGNPGTFPANGAGTADSVFVVTEAGQEAGRRAFIARRVWVETGASTINEYEVVSGLREGDLVVTGGLDSLHDGSRILPRNPAPRGSPGAGEVGP